ncbi:MAG: PolC-type DNA polymerase III [Lachnospira sp.]
MINNYVALDLETTGLNPARDKIIEIGMAKVVGGRVTEKYSSFINPEVKLSERIIELTGITQQDVDGAPVISDIIGDVLLFIGEMPILGHNIIFDYSFLKKACVNNNLAIECGGIDTLKIARRVLPQVEKKSLEALCKYLNIDPGNSHRALDDALSAHTLYEEMYKIKPEDSGFEFVGELVYSVKKDVPITPKQVAFLSALANQRGIVLHCPIESLTKSEASRTIDRILSGEITPDC